MSILNARARREAMLCAAVAVNVAMFHPVLAQDAGNDVEEVIVTAIGHRKQCARQRRFVLDRERTARLSMGAPANLRHRQQRFRFR